ncbi:MAG: (6-4) photolyase [Alphaproteobacteria bacterium MarineAlpha2_Bin1]|nr:MAG: (6-4) photolyase [Alphaproteobacteria bacterium MarineAlpha2_Bin1]
MANKKKLLLILGNQLFPINEIRKTGIDNIFMAEDYGLCNEHKHHKLKILIFLSAMREYKKYLIKNKLNVHYFSINDSFQKSYEEKIKIVLNKNNYKEINFFEIEDKFFSERIYKLSLTLDQTSFNEIKSPMFLSDKNYFAKASDNKSIRLTPFYKKLRNDLSLLINNDGSPVGGKWSFDEENRKKIPKNLSLPKKPINLVYNDFQELSLFINKKFSKNPGNLKNTWIPITRDDSLKWLNSFLKYKLTNFGDYEDAINSENNFLFHSALSVILNLGLITPKELIEKLKNFKKNNYVPLNSYEGFIRQIIGWREFIRCVYHRYGDTMINSNYWKSKRSMKQSWYSGNTGIIPLDDSIKHCINYGYTHHIPRLMIIANIMTLADIHPVEIYNWFMEMFVDSSDWVMVPNVFGMGTFADGGKFSTKPYICGSNYILKMSNYKKAEWCDIVDGLYWKFIEKNKNFFKKNPRLSIMTRSLDKIDKNRKKYIFDKANNFILTNTKLIDK